MLETAIEDFALNIQELETKTRNTLESYQSGIYLEDFSQRILNACVEKSIQLIQSTFKGIIKSLSELRTSSNSKITFIEKELKRIQDQIRPYTEKIQDQKRLERLETQLSHQRATLEAYNDKTRHITGVTENGRESRKSLLNYYSSLLNLYLDISIELQKDQFSKIDEDITLDAEVSFNTEAFDKSFCDLFDRRYRFNVAFGDAFDDTDEFQFHPETHLETITSIFDELSKVGSTKFTLRKHVTTSQSIRRLFENYFTIDYNLRYLDDDILEMSPGKRGLVLLQLILHISNATHPILIDQPEDNLDNRTISGELKRFIRLKKVKRQILMITHNANLVVLTDAENVIVSNQAGQQIGRENAEYRFEYINGSLEHSFRHDHIHEHDGILQSSGIREHVCDILEGGEEAFRQREQRYGFSWE
jgi:uncharacterized coiled-coil protein SlyX